MKLAFLELAGFRGYRDRLRLDFGEAFTVIDGRNGVGKSTIFDAIEFALTGRLGKYDEQKAAGETIDDYVWWRGDGPVPIDRYVRVGFRDEVGEAEIVRKEFNEPDEKAIQTLQKRLCDVKIAPASPLRQLCVSAIIRDEQITKLSLDLKESDRYALLRDALGAIDSESWIARGAKVLALTKRRTAAIQQEINALNWDLANASRRVHEVRATLVAEPVIAEAIARLQTFANSSAQPEQLIGFVREKIAALNAELDGLLELLDRWDTVERDRANISALKGALEIARADEELARTEMDRIGLDAGDTQVTASALSDQARQLISLAALGRKLGLQDEHCPLCAHNQTPAQFEAGILRMEALAQHLHEDAARTAQKEQSLKAAADRFATAQHAVKVAEEKLAAVIESVRVFDERRSQRGIEEKATREDLQRRIAEVRASIDGIQRDVRVVETLRMSTELERVERADVDARTRFARMQERFGKARKAETAAQTLYDAARRAAAETLDQRLERVLPLMSELYRRLRPHPQWDDIEYSIRGDVRRFLSFRVGEDLNPQFLFSSGQRRATGLAFLLAVNLSLAWSRWRTILLDDPVQHIDDYRAFHLAEVAGQLVASGRQIVCAVEDPALADLLCRRLPIGRAGAGRRVTLGPDGNGALAKQDDRALPPLVHQAMTTDQPQPNAV